jgi:hypothetical protein
VIARGEIQTGENGRALKLVKSIINARHGILVLNSEFVKCAIVNDHAKATVFLLDEKDWCSIWRRRRFDVTLFQKKFGLSLGFEKLSPGQAVERARWRFAIGIR